MKPSAEQEARLIRAEDRAAYDAFRAQSKREASCPLRDALNEAFAAYLAGKGALEASCWAASKAHSTPMPVISKRQGAEKAWRKVAA